MPQRGAYDDALGVHATRRGQVLAKLPENSRMLAKRTENSCSLRLRVASALTCQAAPHATASRARPTLHLARWRVHWRASCPDAPRTRSRTRAVAMAHRMSRCPQQRGLAARARARRSRERRLTSPDPREQTPRLRGARPHGSGRSSAASFASSAPRRRTPHDRRACSRGGGRERAASGRSVRNSDAASSAHRNRKTNWRPCRR
mmetsp:Transcript_110234/g.308177  ORF Transcript_110234/g.308177 Transcript_110234/m.308177 type:complete len:204 (+) Transcript_110234:275-886(+)